MNGDLKKYYLPPLQGRAGSAVLDFGSGTGRVIEFLQGNGFSHVRGYDRDESLRAQLSPAVSAVTEFGADGIAYLRSSKTKWDVVILKDVLYYFDDASALEFLRELSKHLNENALVLVEIFNGAAITGPFVLYKDRGIRRIFTEHSLSSLLEEAGFKMLSMRGMAPVPRGPRSILFFLGSRAWLLMLSLIYWLERGWDSQNPSTLEKKILAVAKK
jgi:2-polyprenyl-3-methyl-5-hydroxy-6-metoxy-1,4-benzoquinol methylase